MKFRKSAIAKFGSLLGALRRNFSWPTLCLAGLLFFPNVMEDDYRYDWMPISPIYLRMCLVCLVLCLMFFSFMRHGFSRSGVLFLFVALFSLFAVAIFNSDLSEYATTKVDRLFTSTLICAVAPIFLIRDRKQLNAFFYAVAVVGLLYGSLGLISLLRNPEMIGRLSAMGSNPITLARMTSFPLLWFAFLGISGRISGWWAALVVGPAFMVILATGSRGPLFASVLALALAIFLVRSERKFFGRRSLAVLIFTGALASVIAFKDFLPERSVGRVESFLAGKFGESERTRTRAAEVCLEEIPRRPEGHGWGAFAPLSGIVVVVEANVFPYAIVTTEALRYPHNVFLEVFLEAGWLAGFLYTLMVVLALVRSWTAANTLEIRMLFILTLYAAMAACASGDVNSNRLVLSLMGLGMAAGAIARGDTMVSRRSPRFKGELLLQEAD